MLFLLTSLNQKFKVHAAATAEPSLVIINRASKTCQCNAALIMKPCIESINTKNVTLFSNSKDVNRSMTR